MLHESTNAVAVQQRWEYMSERIESLEGLEIILNNAGQHRWELVNLLQINEHWVAVYKRPQKKFGARHEPVHDRVVEKMVAKPR